jgi:hypothetical protein
MPHGAVEVIALSFPAEGPGPGVVEQFAKLVESGTISLLDALYVAHDADGTWRSIEVEEDTEFLAVTGLEFTTPELLSVEDGELIASSLEPGTCAVVVAYEHTWAKPLREAIFAAGGELLLQVRIPPETVDEAELSGASA